MTTSGNELPSPIRVGIAGVLGAVALIVGATVFRAPIDDQCVPTATAATGRSSPQGASPARAPKEPATPSGDSAAPARTTGASRPAEVPANVPADAREARAKFSKDMQQRRIKESVASLLALLEVDPNAPADGDVRDDVIELAMRVTLLEGPEPDAVFDAISSKMGTLGGDILYELLTTRGGSRAAKRAEDLLKNPAVRGRASPALRIAYELRTAKSCDDKVALLDRAKTDGDGRALGLLQLLNRECGRRSRDECCLKDEPKLKEAIEAIKASRSN
jgi:eukaryotic-like serine/threonine-protein kinase